LLVCGDSAYNISYADYSTEMTKTVPADKLLEEGRDAGIQSVNGRLISEKRISLEGSPGREVVIDLPGSEKVTVRARLYLVDNRLYDIVFGGPPAAAKGPSTDAFMASFKLYKPKQLPDAWIPLVSSDGRFSITMPGKPAPSVIKTELKDGVHLWQLISEKDEASYFAAYNDLPTRPDSPEDLEKALDSGVAAVSKSLNASVVNEKLLSVDGNPGRKEATNANGSISMDLEAIASATRSTTTRRLNACGCHHRRAGRRRDHHHRRVDLRHCAGHSRRADHHHQNCGRSTGLLALSPSGSRLMRCDHLTLERRARLAGCESAHFRLNSARSSVKQQPSLRGAWSTGCG
jgi:hypothetical protein